MLVTALFIFMESGLARALPAGTLRRGRTCLTLYKFRSMRTGAESDGTPRWASVNDDRTTRVGRIIRKLRIDSCRRS